MHQQNLTADPAAAAHSVGPSGRHTRAGDPVRRGVRARTQCAGWGIPAATGQRAVVAGDPSLCARAATDMLVDTAGHRRFQPFPCPSRNDGIRRWPRGFPPWPGVPGGSPTRCGSVLWSTLQATAGPAPGRCGPDATRLRPAPPSLIGLVERPWRCAHPRPDPRSPDFNRSPPCRGTKRHESIAPSLSSSRGACGTWTFGVQELHANYQTIRPQHS